MKSETGNKTCMYFNLPQNDFMPNTWCLMPLSLFGVPEENHLAVASH
jgi:hypothetical protein